VFWLTETADFPCCNCCLDVLVCFFFGSEVGFLHFFCGGTEMNERDIDGSAAAADADCGLSSVSIGIAGLGQVMSWDAGLVIKSRILWYKYHWRSIGKPGGANWAGPMLLGMEFASLSI